MLKSGNEKRRSHAASLLGEFGDPQAVPLLIEVLQHDKSDRARHSTAYALSELKDPRAFDALLAALDDPYEQTRMYTAMGLGQLKDVRAVGALKKASQDEHPMVRNFANWALEWIENSSTH